MKIILLDHFEIRELISHKHYDVRFAAGSGNVTWASGRRFDYPSHDGKDGHMFAAGIGFTGKKVLTAEVLY